MYRLIFISLCQSALLCGGQVMLKLAVTHMNRSCGWWQFFTQCILQNWWLMVCGILMTVAALLWMYILKHFDFSIAYPLSAMAFVFGALAGILVFHETINWYQWIGIVVILFGCFLVAS